ncbi:hypothetical protein [Lentzea sp. NBRC 102530]|uniref:hypothetical protein n=1 Tax=Lentzea sp. NBRC 102530 TaxID=3032201 RepID=UPI0024A51D63|nr:hypothetical protein [Lentzea sp. NBRC 102530]GLY54853.1 hypothetical protein Lesp01_85080 [Lentzea sp. NBRC 102530]
MAVQVRASTSASRTIASLRGKDKTAYEQWLARLKTQGCAAMKYRLAGERLNHLCVSHLHGTMRAVVRFESATRAAIVAIGPHDRKSPNDIYTLLYAALGTEDPDDDRTKPDCCDSSGLPPIWQEAVDVVDQVDAIARRQRRR